MPRSMKSTAVRQESDTEENVLDKEGKHERGHEVEGTRQRLPESKEAEGDDMKLEKPRMPTLARAASISLSILIVICMCAITYFGNEYKTKRQEIGFGRECGAELGKIILSVAIAIFLVAFKSCLVRKYGN